MGELPVFTPEQALSVLADRKARVVDVVRAVAAVRDNDLRQAVPLLVGWLRDTDIAIVDVASATLARFGAREAIPDLLDLLRPEAEDERRINCVVDPFGWYEPPPRESAAFALGELGALEAVPALRGLREDPVPGVREAACAALARLEAGAKGR